MKRNYLPFLLMLAICLNTISVFAQRIFPNKTCATQDVVYDYLKNNFDLSKGLEDGPASNQRNDYTVPLVNTDTTYTIPVVVHVVYLDDNKYENISDELIQSQIDALNRDFNLKNDFSIVRPEFQEFIGNAKIRFELAKVNPQGQPTTGITRKKSRPTLAPDWNPISNNVKQLVGGGTPPWPWKRYLNIWVCDLNMRSRVCPTCVDICDSCGLLGGYAQPPKGLPNWVLNIGGVQTDASAAFADNTDGVVIDFRFFGQFNEFNKDYLNNSPVYGLGRTTVHEVGHYLGLRHTWGDYGAVFGDGCSYDDGIGDTPNEELPYATYITPDNICGNIVNSCTTAYPVNGIDYPDMQENYMNYSTDICYAMFTKEQVNMMRYALTEKRSQLIIKREIETTTGFEQLTAANNGIEIFPNPTKGLLNIRNNNASSNETIVEIYNHLGAVVSSVRIPAYTTNYSIDLSKQAPSMYFLRFTQGNTISTERIVLH